MDADIAALTIFQTVWGTMQIPKIRVVMSVYNYTPYFVQSIESILA